MKQFKGKTPNALPPTMLTLGEDFNGGSISREAALKVTAISTISIGSKGSPPPPGEKSNYYPYHLIDIETADNRIFMRSRNLRINQKQLRDRMRALTRKLAMFQFENRSQCC